MDFDNDLEEFATAVVAGWADVWHGSRLDDGICDLYVRNLPFPPSWSPHERDEFVEEQVGRDATSLATSLDDACDLVVDGFGREHGYLPHDEDASMMIQASRKESFSLLLDGFEYLQDELAAAAIHRAGRTVGSMTACSQAARRAHRARNMV